MQDKYFCQCCGAELTEDNAREVNKKFSQSGLSPYCIECEQAYYERLAAVEGNSLALFHACAAFNVPCKPIVLDGAKFGKDDGRWFVYTSLLAEKGEDMKGNEPATFFDGETDILKVFGKYFSEKDFAEYIKHERAALDKLVGTKEQRDKWGVLPLHKDLPMTAAIYDELDRQYDVMASSFRGQTLSLRQEDIMKKVARNNVIYDYLLRQGLVKSAVDIQKSNDLLLASEELRKKDEKPVEGYRTDSQAVALEAAGFMESGKLLPCDKLQEVIFNRFIKRRKFDYTLDACDAVLERNWNTMRANSDVYISTELPAELEVEDEWGEFAEEESEDEKENKKFIGTTKVVFEKKKTEASEKPTQKTAGQKPKKGDK